MTLLNSAAVYLSQEIGILLGCLVERILSESEADVCLLTRDDLTRASKVFENILLKCRHWVSSIMSDSIDMIYNDLHSFQIHDVNQNLSTRGQWRALVWVSPSSVLHC